MRLTVATAVADIFQVTKMVGEREVVGKGCAGCLG